MLFGSIFVKKTKFVFLTKIGPNKKSFVQVNILTGSFCSVTGFIVSSISAGSENRKSGLLYTLQQFSWTSASYNVGIMTATFVFEDAVVL